MHLKTAVVAIGGNSLIPAKDKIEVKYQWDAVRETCQHIAEMVREGWRVVITHGNGPQVGFILRRAEIAAPQVHGVPLDLIVADTQGSIGYMVQQALRNSLRALRISKHVVTLVTQTLVNSEDPAFQHPDKPIGGFLSPAEAEMFRAEGWTVVEDAGRGLRRVIASPDPLEIIELDTIRRVILSDAVVIAVGGGGVPVIRNSTGELRGVAAVIDKDRASSLLAQGLNADLLLISTGVEQVAINFNKPNQQMLSSITLKEARDYMEQGHFAAGSMRPKIEAVIRFLEHGGPTALITSPENIGRALRGETGTWFHPR